jgi:hypothetical protein
MFKETTLTDNNDGLNDVLNRVHYLEEQVNILNMKIFPDEGLPGFEFYVEADGEDIWSGLDLKTNFPKILQKFPNNEIVINWRSLPVTIL